MNSQGYRGRLGGVLFAVALGAIAMLALPAIGIGHGGGDGGHGPRAAGTVESFDSETGELVIDLAEGESISGLVLRRTHIRCGEGAHHFAGRPHHRGHGATASRRGEGEPGEDRGDHGLEAGDDHGGRAPRPGEEPGVAGEPDDGAGEHEHGHGHHGERCNTSDLVPSAVVMKAEIVLTHGNAFYKKIGLLPPQFAEPEAPSTP